ncbi:MAG: hypothetical protein ACKOXG_06715 [Arenimonas sp.]
MATMIAGARTPAMSGMAQALGSILGGNAAEQAGADHEMTRQTKIAQALASIRAHDAQAGEAAQKAIGLKRANDLQTPDAIRSRAMLTAGAPLDAAGDVDQYLTTGRIDKYQLGDGQAGPVLPAPDWAKPQNMSRIAQAMVADQAVIGGGAKSQEDYFKGQNQQFETALARGLVDGTAPKASVSPGMAILKASPVYKIPEGYTGDQYTGAIDVQAPVNASRQGLVAAQTGAQKANAAQSYAAAGASNAHAGLFRAQADEVKNGPKGQFDSARGIIVDPRTGQSRDVIGQDGKPIGAKDKDLNGEQANALAFASRMKAADDILSGLAEKGVTQPSMIKRGADSIPMIGGAAGMAANKMAASSGQQQVEQAQRDFINAVLRRESGAAISMGEFANAAQQYFPQPGDKPAVIEQKRLARQRATNAMMEAVPMARRKFVDAPQAAPQTGGATGSWDAPGGWSIERVN